MLPHDRAVELFILAKRDEHAAHVLAADGSVEDELIGFHYQQATEKLLKALLAERNIDFPRTHDIVRLMELVDDADYDVPAPLQELASLTSFAVALRYEMESSSVLAAEDVREMVEQLRTWVEAELRQGESNDSSQ